MDETSVKKGPAAKGNSFGVSTAIWDNKSKAGKEYQSVSIKVSYPDKDNKGQYKTRDNLYPFDLENLIKALTALKADADEKGIQTGFKAKE